MCPSLRVFRVRPEDEPEDKVLRVRPEAGLQEMLRQVSGRVTPTVEESSRANTEEGCGLKRSRDCRLLQ